jgi:hypothetical protein
MILISKIMGNCKLGNMYIGRKKIFIVLSRVSIECTS